MCEMCQGDIGELSLNDKVKTNAWAERYVSLMNVAFKPQNDLFPDLYSTEGSPSRISRPDTLSSIEWTMKSC